MNCKQGDLAIFVTESKAGNEGKIVRCLELVNGHVFAEDGCLCHHMGTSEGAKWKVDKPIRVLNRFDKTLSDCYYVFDSALKPIRGDVTDQDVADTYSSCQESKHKVKV